MQGSITITQLDPMSAVRAVEATLRRIDSRLMDHGERVAYLACRLCAYGKLGLDMKTLFLLSVFHDVGAYKTDEIDRMLEFESRDVRNHAIYGYLFLKYMSPLEESAQALLYHHSSWPEILAGGSPWGDYAALIHLADRVDISAAFGAPGETLAALWDGSGTMFKPEYLALLRAYAREEDVLAALRSGAYKKANAALCRRLAPSPEEALAFIQMIVFSLDFRSEHTVTHSINTISLALHLARHFGLSAEETERIYLGALVHDVGKIAVPMEILEYPGRLNDEQMRVMRTHVDETEKLIRGVVPDAVCDIAIRHHEKLDGSGYPRGLRAPELTLSQRIVAVADIVSALNSHRSYKEPFPKEKTIRILRDMARTQLDAQICAHVCEHYDEILRSTESDRAEVIEAYQNITREFERFRNADGQQSG